MSIADPTIRRDGWQAEHVGVTTADGEQPSAKPRWTWSRELHEANQHRGVEVLPAERSLDELAAIANREHAAAVSSAWDVVQHCIQAGSAIYAAREQINRDIEPGKRWSAWVEWVSSNLNFTHGYANRYLRLHEHQEILPREAFLPYKDAKGAIRQPSMHRAMSYLRGLRSETRPTGIQPGSHRTVPKGVADEARRLRRQGVSVAVICALLDVSRASVQRWTVPGAAARDRAVNRRHAAKRRAAQAALRREQTAAAARKMAGRIADVNSWTRQSLPIVQKELDESQPGELRRELEGLMRDLYRVEDRLKRIIGMGKQ